MPDKFRERTAWSKCTKFRLPSFLVNILDRLQRKRNGGNKTLHIYHRNLTNTLVRQPAEVILLIADFLPPASRVLLSLSCKRLRVVLTKHFDFTFTDNDLRVEFLLLLERDLPDYLTCHSCAVMFQWRLRKHMGYRCSRSRFADFHAYPESPCPSHDIKIRSEVVDLIMRAHHRGQKHGLPASIIDHECDSHYSISETQYSHQKLEGRMINGHLIFARLLIHILDVSDLDGLGFYPFGFRTCVHSTGKVCSEIDRKLRHWDGREVLHLGTVKCETCATDVRTRISPQPIDHLARVEVNIWQHYGNQLPHSRRMTLLFYDGVTQLDRTNPIPRDLEHDYNASEQAGSIE